MAICKIPSKIFNQYKQPIDVSTALPSNWYTPINLQHIWTSAANLQNLEFQFTLLQGIMKSFFVCKILETENQTSQLGAQKKCSVLNK